eukprot:8450079-Alexandrium_andersonii.AAC.1
MGNKPWPSSDSHKKPLSRPRFFLVARCRMQPHVRQPAHPPRPRREPKHHARMSLKTKRPSLPRGFRISR